MEGSFGAGIFRKVHALFHRYSRIVPVNGHDEYYKGGTANNFALCTEICFCTKGFLCDASQMHHAASSLCRRQTIMGRCSYKCDASQMHHAASSLCRRQTIMGRCSTNVMHLRCIIDHLLRKGRYHEQRIKQDL